MTDLFGNQGFAVQHPGWGCCDPAQDLAGWIARQRARIELNRRWVSVLHQRGRRLRDKATAAYVAGDVDAGRVADLASIRTHGLANEVAQRMLVRGGHVDRVEEAHRGRLHDGRASEEGETRNERSGLP